ncbi:MAG: hypothetical protein ABIK89_01685 [Planctomycetota bacterium]
MSDRSAREAPTNENSLARSLVWTAWTLLTHAIAACVLLGAPFYVVPKFLAIFEEFGAALPRMTILAIDLSHVAASYWYLLVVFGLGLAAAVLFGLSLLPAKAKWLGTLWASTVLLVVILFLGFVMVAILLPLEALITQLA